MSKHKDFWGIILLRWSFFLSPCPFRGFEKVFIRLTQNGNAWKIRSKMYLVLEAYPPPSKQCRPHSLVDHHCLPAAQLWPGLDTGTCSLVLIYKPWLPQLLHKLPVSNYKRENDCIRVYDRLQTLYEHPLRVYMYNIMCVCVSGCCVTEIWYILYIPYVVMSQYPHIVSLVALLRLLC